MEGEDGEEGVVSDGEATNGDAQTVVIGMDGVLPRRGATEAPRMVVRVQTCSGLRECCRQEVALRVVREQISIGTNGVVSRRGGGTDGDARARRNGGAADGKPEPHTTSVPGSAT